MDYSIFDIHFGTLLVANPVVTPVLIFVLVLLFLLSFLLSGSEIAFFSLTKKDVNMLKTRQQPSYKRIVTLLENPKSLMASLLISNCLVNIAIILIANTLISDWIDGLDMHMILSFVIKGAVITIILLLFGEILPKVWATNHKIWFASTGSLVVELFHNIFNKISIRLVKLTTNIEKGFRSDALSRGNNQLDDAIDLLPDNEASMDEKEILKGIKKFGKTTAKQTMRTRLDVSGIEINMPFKEMMAKVRDLHYSRIPVYRNNLDDIAGMLHTKDLLSHLHENDDFDWHALMRPVFYIHEQKLIEDLLQDFRNKRRHIAVVVDEFGGTSGIITLEDIMEEIIGDIQDEFDDEENPIKKIDEYNYVFEGKIMINDLCRILRLPSGTFDALRGESDSLAGLLLEIAGEFPAVNEPLQTDQYIFTPLLINKNRIEKVKVTFRTPEKL